MKDKIIVRGAKEHNLKNVSVELPRDALVVFTGLSGSGKSSLAFDTIFAEGQRRYVESLSSYARQFLGQMDKPDVEFIDGLSPAVSIDQKSTSHNPRSTVGTVTEVWDYLRLLFARAGEVYCPSCGQRLGKQTPQQITEHVMLLPEDSKYSLLAPIVKGKKGEHVELLSSLLAKGFTRARVDGQVVRLGEEEVLDKQKAHTIEVVVDRVSIKSSARRRISDSIETALNLSSGYLTLLGTDNSEIAFSEHLACLDCNVSVPEMEPRTFSFNSPFGACPDCAGLGSTRQVDIELVVPSEDLTIKEGALAPWSGRSSDYFEKTLQAVCLKKSIPMDVPWKKLTKAQRELLLWGQPPIEVRVSYTSHFSGRRTYDMTFEGVATWLERRYKETSSDSERERFGNFLRDEPCLTCKGARLKPEVLAVKVGGKSISDIADLSVREANTFLDQIQLGAKEAKIAERVLKEIQSRLTFLLDVGLDYLSLSRGANTLSGGEAQRIRLATQIGSALSGVLYVLDEPSIGLHQRDNQRLLATMQKLKDLGNTLIVVEHDEDTIRAADWVVDVGPLAGELGGNIVYSGDYPGLLKAEGSLTGDYLSGAREISVPKTRRKGNGTKLQVVKASAHNLKDVTVSFPLGTLTCVSGVSGSGKSTLVNDILLKGLQNKLMKGRNVPGKHQKITGAEALDKVIAVDQSPIGRTPRSNPATYIGVFDKIRTLFAATEEAKVRGYGPGRFSFNVRGGRCETCSGDGTLRIEMNFLPDVYVPCETCDGKRYNKETLEVHYKGKTVADVLGLSVSDATEFFKASSSISRQLQTLVDVGLGYVRLGQAATTLSGGEAQRVKLASELQKRSTGKTVYVLDEPTTGLHFEDIKKLLSVLSKLVESGNSVIVIEHNLDVIKSADWLIDMGPEGGTGGGEVVGVGTPETLAKNTESRTGVFLKDLLR